MRFEPGFVASLREELKNVPSEFRERVERPGGLNADMLLSLVSRPEQPFIKHVERVGASNLVDYDVTHSFVGLEALTKGEVVFCVLDDDSSMLRFDDGLPLLGLKLIQASMAGSCLLMVDPSKKEDLISHVNALSYPGTIGAFEQFETYSLTPDNRLAMSGDKPLLSTTGTGDLVAAMHDSDVLPALVAAGVKYVIVAESSSALASTDPNVLGQHIVSKKTITYSVTERQKGEAEAVVAFCDGEPRLAELSQLPEDFLDELDQTPMWQSTGSLIVNVEALNQPIDLHWHRTRRQSGEKLLVSYQRHVSELSFHHDSAFVKVPRKSYYFRIRNDSEMKQLAELLFQQW